MLPTVEDQRKVPLPEDDFETDKMWQSVNEIRRTEDHILVSLADWRKQPLLSDNDYMKLVNWCCKAYLVIQYTTGHDLEPSERRAQEDCRRTVRAIDNATDAIHMLEVGAHIGRLYRIYRYQLGINPNTEA